MYFNEPSTSVIVLFLPQPSDVTHALSVAQVSPSLYSAISKVRLKCASLVCRKRLPRQRGAGRPADLGDGDPGLRYPDPGRARGVAARHLQLRVDPGGPVLPRHGPHPRGHCRRELHAAVLARPEVTPTTPAAKPRFTLAELTEVSLTSCSTNFGRVPADANRNRM